MKVTVFRGPSISHRAATDLLAAHPMTADVRGPAAQGDVWAAAERGAEVVVLIDGVYERVPAVWHKEILAALQAGVVVVGTSSMGALRAAECAPFGMVGRGSVYQQVVAGEIVADADVAVAHADEEDDHRPLSVALVDIRATLAAVVRDDLLSASAGAALTDAAVQLGFRERNWPTITSRAGLPGATARLLRDHQVSLKQADARATLHQLPEVVAHAPREHAWRLQDSDAWQRAAGTELDPQLAASLQASPRWPDLLRAGLLRAIALELVPAVPVDVALAELAAGIGADDAAAVEVWAHRMELDEAALLRFADGQARLARLWQQYGHLAEHGVADQLRVEGSWPAVRTGAAS